jgi:hypothetical protein
MPNWTIASFHSILLQFLHIRIGLVSAAKFSQTIAVNSSLCYILAVLF